MFRADELTLADLDQMISSDGPVRRKHIYLRRSDSTKAVAIQNSGKNVLIGDKAYSLSSLSEICRAGIELMHYWVFKQSPTKRLRHTNTGLDRQKELSDVKPHCPPSSHYCRTDCEGLQGVFITNPTVGVFQTLEEGQGWELGE